MGRTGHSYIKKLLKDAGAVLAGENVGAPLLLRPLVRLRRRPLRGVRLLEILAASPESPTERLAALPKGISTPEVRIEMPRGRAGAVHGAAPRRTPRRPGDSPERGSTPSTERAPSLPTDGRSSPHLQHLPSLTLRLEADSEAALERIAGDVRGLLLRLNPDLEVPL